MNRVAQFERFGNDATSDAENLVEANGTLSVAGSSRFLDRGIGATSRRVAETMGSGIDNIAGNKVNGERKVEGSREIRKAADSPQASDAISSIDLSRCIGSARMTFGRRVIPLVSVAARKRYQTRFAPSYISDGAVAHRRLYRGWPVPTFPDKFSVRAFQRNTRTRGDS